MIFSCFTVLTNWGRQNPEIANTVHVLYAQCRLFPVFHVPFYYSLQGTSFSSVDPGLDLTESSTDDGSSPVVVQKTGGLRPSITETNALVSLGGSSG